MPDTSTPSTTDTRRRILDATIELIADGGWGGVSTRLVADRAGVNNALVNYHFGTKSALLLEATTTALAEELAEPTRMLLEAPTLRDGLREFGRWLRDLDAARPTVAVFTESLVQAGRLDEVRTLIVAVLDDFRSGLAAVLQREIDAERLPPDADATSLATALTAFLDGLAVHRLVDPELDILAALDAMITPLFEGETS